MFTSTFRLSPPLSLCRRGQCYLCKQPGHTTLTCPYRIKPETAAASTSQQAAVRRSSAVYGVLNRQVVAPPGGSPVAPALRRTLPTRWVVSATIARLHTRRISAMAFHTKKSDILLTGDKVRGHTSHFFVGSRSARASRPPPAPCPPDPSRVQCVD